MANSTEEPAAPAETILEIGNGWLEEFLPYHLYRVTNLLNDRLQGKLRLAGINPSQWRVLSVLRSGGRMSLSRVVDMTLMEQPTVSKVVAQMEQGGLVHRRPSPDDSRFVEVALTDKGLATFEEIVPFAYRHQKTAMDGLSDEDRAALRSLLDRIAHNIVLER
jgi:DNA-binding MarR family transcriptional regulator